MKPLKRREIRRLGGLRLSLLAAIYQLLILMHPTSSLRTMCHSILSNLPLHHHTSAPSKFEQRCLNPFVKSPKTKPISAQSPTTKKKGRIPLGISQTKKLHIACPNPPQ